jgi:hypothetical protein
MNTIHQVEVMQEDQRKDGKTNNHENGKMPDGLHPIADDI